MLGGMFPLFPGAVVAPMPFVILANRIGIYPKEVADGGNWKRLTFNLLLLKK